MNVSLSGGFVFDSHGGRALQGRVGTGSSISAGDVGANVQFQITGKDYVEQLQENSRETGASTDLPGNIVIARAGIRGGIDTVSSGQDLGMNINVGVGAGLGPAEGHTNTGETHVQVIHSALPLDPKSPVFITTPKPAQPVNITSNEPRQFMFVLPPPPGAWITTPQTPVMTGPNAPIIVQLSQNYIDPQTGGPNYAAY